MEKFNSENQRIAQAIIYKLETFGIKLELKDIIVGASVTRYVFGVLSIKTRMSEFRQYLDDIKFCAETTEEVMIEAPLSGQAAIGIDIANKERRPVYLQDILERPEYKKASGDLVFALGEEVDGSAVVCDLTKLPHVLVAGSTGSGKSTVLNNLIVSLVSKYGPDYVRFVTVDPEFVELSRYNGLPHMLTREAITSVRDALASMDYLIDEMERRYYMFRENCVATIRDYNIAAVANSQPRLPYLVLVIDELADLMIINKSAFEAKFMRLAQKSRAAGIHIVMATQRPDVRVVTGTIKANTPCRVALRMASTYDSQTVLNSGGAERLIGSGDMLLMDWSSSNNFKRVQSAYISYVEVRSVVENAKQKYAANFDQAADEAIFVSRNAPDEEDDSDGRHLVDENALTDELYDDYKRALRYWLERNNGKASISSIQRGICVGFNRAGRILENLQRAGYVETLPDDEKSCRALKVLVTLDDLDKLFPDKK